MAITWQSAGTANVSSSGGGTVAPAYPSSIASGDLLVLVIGMKPSSANSGGVTTPNLWTALTPITGAGGYGATLGGDTGNTNLFAFYTTAIGTESGSLTVNVSTNNVCWGTIHRVSGATRSWSVASATGSDTTADASWSVTMSSDPGTVANDLILIFACIPTDIQTNQFSSHTISQTGATFSAVTEVQEFRSGTGNDIAGYAARCTVSTGPGTANPVVGSTVAGTNTNVRGPGMLIRIRELPAVRIPYGCTPVGIAV